MKLNQYLITLLLLMTMTMAVVTAHAEDFAYKAALKQTSLTRGFSQATLPVLHRVSAASQEQVSAALVAKLCAGCALSKAAQGSNLQLTGTNVVLSVSADGTSADFRNPSVEAKAHALAKPLAQEMSQSALEQAGRAFIAANLGDVVSLGADEEMVALSTDYRIEGLQNLSTGAVTRNVAANRIAFGRTLNGVPVVGNGSTIVVTFANDGSVESFHYDWPKYATTTGPAQNIANAASLLARVQQVVGARTGVTPAFTVHVPAANSAPNLDLNPGTKLQSLQCGYYDPGANSGYAEVQAGCVYHAVYADTMGVRQGYAGAIPGALVFQTDAKWPETQVVPQQ